MREVMLIIHFTGLVMGVGSSFAFLFIMRAASKRDEKGAPEFVRNILPLGTMGYIGLTLSIISGGYLMTPFWGSLPTLPVLVAKLLLVVVLAVFVVVIGIASRKAKKGDLNGLKKIKRLGPFPLVIGISIMILAVLVFR